MKILLIDSEAEEIRKLKNQIDWESYGIESAATAYSEKTAKETAKNQQPELVFCSTQIAEDGGFSLLAKIKSLVPGVGIVLMGRGFSEEIFRRLLYLEAVDYLKKPVSEEEFSQAVERFKKRRLKQQEEREEKRYGRYWKNNQRMIQEMFWKKLCLNRIPGGPEEIEAAAEEVDANLDKDCRYRMVLITFANEDEMRSAWGEDLCQAAVQNLARAFVKKKGDSSKVIVIYTRVVILLDEEEFDTAQERCRILADRCRSEFKAELLCYLSEPVFCEQIADTYSCLLTYSKDDVLQQNRIICVGKQSGGEKREIVLPETWGELLYTKEPPRLGREVEKFLVPLARQGQLSEQNFRIFQQDMLQLFFTYMEKKEMRAHELYDNHEIYRLYKIAILSIDGMCRWVSKCTEYITGQNRPREAAQGAEVVRKVKEYIRSNLKNDITMEQIAGVTHLNPDYTTRIFRSKTGMTVRGYLIKKRMERAKTLLQTTGLSVSEIAMESGYDNFSYFIRVFRQYFGVTPRQFRKGAEQRRITETEKDNSEK